MHVSLTDTRPVAVQMYDAPTTVWVYAARFRTREEAEAWVGSRGKDVTYRVVGDATTQGEAMATKVKKKSGGGRRQAKGQQDLIEHRHPAHKEILEQAERYRAKRDARMDAGKPEAEEREKLIAVMHKHGLPKFEGDGVVVELIEGKEKVRVRAAKDEPPDEGD